MTSRRILETLHSAFCMHMWFVMFVILYAIHRIHRAYVHSYYFLVESYRQAYAPIGRVW